MAQQRATQVTPRRSGAPRYLVRWLTRQNEVREEKARGMAELSRVINEIEDSEGDLMVACVTFYFSLA